MDSDSLVRTPNQLLAPTIQAILADRTRIDFMTVARAMVLQAHLRSASESRAMAANLGISRQTRHNWIKQSEINEWVTLWQDRIEAAQEKGPPPTLKKRRILDSEWQWIAGLLAVQGGGSWADKAAMIRREAGRLSERALLRQISRVTLYRNRGRITAFGELLRREKIAATEAAAKATHESGPVAE